tara:strand:+ start:4647 stop:6104 length:1458 start_codon:yes stop_codon:yes gene_type:complete
MAVERLQKILSNAGVASRRSAEAMIVAGRVAVNGKKCDTLGARADPDVDEITLDGTPVLRERYRYVALNKPAGVLSTTQDDRGRPTVISLINTPEGTLHPVGRLDQASEGLILLTNDGALTELLTHPRHEVRKEYLVAIDQPLGRKGRERLVRGVRHEGEQLKADHVQVVSPNGSAEKPDPRWLLITLHGGRKREIRRMLSIVGRRVVTLRRISIGPLSLGTLPIGESRVLEPEEVEALYSAGKRARDRKPSSMETTASTVPQRPSPIAIDGPAASGKSTLARALSQHFGYVLLDTGLMYRAFTLAALSEGIPATNTTACKEFAERISLRLITKDHEARVVLSGEDVTDQLRAPNIEEAVSDYSAIAGVRLQLVAQQRLFATQPLSLLVGRDIGSVVLPKARIKFFLQAAADVRAERRGQQASEWGGPQSTIAAGRNIRTRDTTDSSRASSPLTIPEGAIVIDTEQLSIDAMIKAAITVIEERTK